MSLIVKCHCHHLPHSQVVCLVVGLKNLIHRNLLFKLLNFLPLFLKLVFFNDNLGGTGNTDILSRSSDKLLLVSECGESSNTFFVIFLFISMSELRSLVSSAFRALFRAIKYSSKMPEEIYFPFHIFFKII